MLIGMLLPEKMMKKNNRVLYFLYKTAPGRRMLRCIEQKHLWNLYANVLRSKWSKALVPIYIKKHNISLEDCTKQRFSSFQDFFARTRSGICVDLQPEHLISPCDGWLCVYPICADSSFMIKNTRYTIGELLKNEETAERFLGGICAIIRLSASDYHHYCYIDDGFHGENHYIEGTLHSVQDLACEEFPVYIQNRRLWTELQTKHFGTVVQIAVGAMAVGEIVNEQENALMEKGAEMGHFDLAGSTIILLFENDRVQFPAQIWQESRNNRETQVRLGEKMAHKI